MKPTNSGIRINPRRNVRILIGKVSYVVFLLSVFVGIVGLVL